MHTNKLPLRNLISQLDGPTTCLRALSCAPGKSLQTCNKNPVVLFEPIESREPLQSVDVDDLSSDQNHLDDVYLAVTSGYFLDVLEYGYLSNMCHSCWLTLANRVLRLYASTSASSETLKTSANFNIDVYAPTLFDMKC